MKHRRVLTIITFLSVSFVTVLGVPTPAYGCSCMDVELHEFADEVDLAFVGRQTSRVVHDEMADNGTVLAIEVDVVYKGEIPAVVDLYTNAHDSACGEDYAQNGRVAIVAFSRQGRPTVNSCSFVTEAELEQEFGAGHAPIVQPNPVHDPAIPRAVDRTWIYLGGAGLVLVAGGGLVAWRRLRPDV